MKSNCYLKILLRAFIESDLITLSPEFSRVIVPQCLTRASLGFLLEKGSEGRTSVKRFNGD